MGDVLKLLFPNVELVGNYDKPSSLECFDIFIRGVGPEGERDQLGRIQLFKKNEKMSRFKEYFLKRMLAPYDRLVLLISGYCDTVELEKAQESWIRENGNRLPKKWKHSSDHPAEVPMRQKEK